MTRQFVLALSFILICPSLGQSILTCGDRVVNWLSTSSSAYYQFTAPSSYRHLAINTCGSKFDTEIYIYTGTQQSTSRTSYKFFCDDCGPCRTQVYQQFHLSSVSSTGQTNLTASQTYTIRLVGYGSAHGQYRLALTCMNTAWSPASYPTMQPTPYPTYSGYTSTSYGSSSTSSSTSTAGSVIGSLIMCCCYAFCIYFIIRGSQRSNRSNYQNMAVATATAVNSSNTNNNAQTTNIVIYSPPQPTVGVGSPAPVQQHQPNPPGMPGYGQTTAFAPVMPQQQQQQQPQQYPPVYAPQQQPPYAQQPPPYTGGAPPPHYAPFNSNSVATAPNAPTYGVPAQQPVYNQQYQPVEQQGLLGNPEPVPVPPPYAPQEGSGVQEGSREGEGAGAVTGH